MERIGDGLRRVRNASIRRSSGSTPEDVIDVDDDGEDEYDEHERQEESEADLGHQTLFELPTHDDDSSR